MRIHYSLILFVLLVSNFSFAKEVKVANAELIAKQFYSTFPSVTRNSGELSCELVYSGNSLTRTNDVNAPAFFVFNIDNGFVIVAGDDISTPILGYSETNRFNVDNMPANLQYWLNLYEQDIEAYRMDENYQFNSAHELWSKPFTSITRNNDALRLNTAKWDQTDPYNQLCPTISSKKAPAGCVATAFAIAMKYHQWPDKGVGSYSYNWNGTTLSITLGTNYPWSKMLDEYVYPYYDAEQGRAVALLMYHCGVLSDMNYTATESGAMTINSVKNIAKYMKYNKGMNEILREWYDNTTWVNMLKDELNLNRPIVYGGSGAMGGHQFIFDGYRGNYFHVNWGWGGLSDGYFLVTYLNPPNLGTGGGSGGFSYGQSAVLGMCKDAAGTSKYNDLLAFFSGTSGGTRFAGIVPNKYIFNQGDQVDLTVGFIGNFGIRDFTGLVRLEHRDKTGNVKSVLGGERGLNDLGIYRGTGFTTKVTITKPIASGDRIVLAYKSSDNNEWKKVLGGSNVTDELMIDAATSIDAPTMNVDNEDVSLIENESSLTIDSKQPMSYIQLINVNGSIVLQQAIKANSYTLNLNDLLQGIYILRVTTDSGVSTHKFSKK